MKETETRNPKTTHIDTETTAGTLRLIQDENKAAVDSLDAALPMIERACDKLAGCIGNGGRVYYIGAGTSGRLGVLDAAECPPTFGVPPEMFTGIIAGGRDCMFRAAENAEDNAEAGERDLAAYNPGENDVVVGISASGDAPYVAGALRYAKSVGCAVIGVTSCRDSFLARETDYPIVTGTGPEVITGSTRMKAGTAQKLVLNMLSTTAMIKTGKVYENLMINLRPTNAKLRRRVISITREITGTDEETAVKLLDANDWLIRTAVNAYRAQKSDERGNDNNESVCCQKKR